MSRAAIDYPGVLRRVLRLVELGLERLGAFDHGAIDRAHEPLSDALDVLHDALDRGAIGDLAFGARRGRRCRMR